MPLHLAKWSRLLKAAILTIVCCCGSAALQAQILSVSGSPTTGPTTAGVAYSATLSASGGIAPYSWSISSGTLPDGLTITPSVDTTTATISGTPTTSGSYDYVVEVTDSTPVIPMTATQEYMGQINPAITSLSPTGVDAGGADFTLTVNGAGFGLDSAVNFNGTTLTPTVVNSTQVTVTIASNLISTPGNAPVTVSSGGGISAAANFTIGSPPSITSVSPTSAVANGADFTLTVNGANFGGDSVVNFGGNPVTPSSISSSQLQLTVPFNLIELAGPAAVTVTSGGATSNSATFDVLPGISSLSPNSATAGAGDVALIVNGSGFASGAVVNFNGTNLATTFVSSTQLTATILSAQIEAADAYPVTVTSGGETSAAATFTVNPAATISSLSPASAQAGASAFTLTVNGANFAANAEVQFNSTFLTTNFVSASQLTALVPANLIAAAGSAAVVAVSGGVPTADATFTILLPDAPAITSPGAASGTFGSMFSYVITATNFPTSYSVIGTLPSGLSFNSGSGAISGLPTQGGTFPLTIGATNPGGTATQALVLTIAPVGQTITFQQGNVFTNNGPIQLQGSSSSSLPVAYSVVSGPATINGSTLTLNGFPGTVTLQATQAGNANYSAALPVTLTFNVTAAHPLLNGSTLGNVSSSQQTITSGFSVLGSGTTTVLVRAVGPALAGFNVSNPLSHPMLSFYSGSTLLATNTGWSSGNATTAVFDQVGAFALSVGSADAALVATVGAGTYTAVASAADGSSGEVLAEVYDAGSQSDPIAILNLSSLGRASSATPYAAGFFLGGTTPAQVLIRAVGPGLTPYGVSNALPSPTLTVYDVRNTILAANAGWGTPETVNASYPAASAATLAQAAGSVYAFSVPAGSNDDAVLMTLPPGEYTSQVTAPPGTAGVVLIEVYEVP
jgi:hypothetical protein